MNSKEVRIAALHQALSSIQTYLDLCRQRMDRPIFLEERFTEEVIATAKSFENYILKGVTK